ncbi:hypothetical protein FIBSPDRAFT_886615 [Athelia psychrophila]|uniref:Uncharacterized protein n=1 Tax=Athelia psychrophila TaxID=1759441 RepID=A0A166QP48_9AGAM|nr:hypothetical protein FIBSPDRAFT_886615 [Fibularhizoctonia sp. CBS 109695]
MSWHVTARNIHTHIDRIKNTPDAPLFDLPVPDCLTFHQEWYPQNVTLLSRAQMNYRKSTYTIVEGHMQLLAFMNNTPFPNTSSEFIAQFTLVPQGMALPALSPKVIADINDTSHTDIFESMKGVLDVAVHISLLALLNDLSFNRFQVSRPNLIEWGQRLGPKPNYIWAAERNF